ncbi:MAG: aconitate hydratase domain protein, partial [Anaerocolumna sp.]|nr:aconitate hydratase domain protein [Anaerocolumna sp.]
MIKLYEKGAYVLNGTEVFDEREVTSDLLTAKTGEVCAKEEAAKHTLAYSILNEHNTSGNMEKLKIK